MVCFSELNGVYGQQDFYVQWLRLCTRLGAWVNLMGELRSSELSSLKKFKWQRGIRSRAMFE